jgi:HlyD family secretion protein
MKEYLNKIKLYIISHKIISIVGLIIISLVGYLIYGKITSTSLDTRYITTKVQKGSIVSVVSGSGQVSALNQIEIKSKASGDITYLNVQNGQKVTTNTLIAQLDSKNAQKSVRDAEINLESAKIALAKLRIQKSNENMTADLVKAYDDGFTIVSNTFLDLPSILTNIDNTLGDRNLTDNAARISGKTAQDYRSKAETAYYTAEKSLSVSKIYYAKLDRNSPKEDINKIINQTYDTTKLFADAVKSLRNYVDFMSDDTENNSSFTSLQDILSIDDKTISGHLSELLSTKTNIKSYTDAFLNSDLDIQSSELSLKQKENALLDAKENLADYFIRAPFSGTITTINIKKSDTVSTGIVVATIITEQQLAEISLNEVDVAKVKVGEKATLSFDAIPGLTISGVVIEIDSIGAISQGVVTYNVKINFDTQDERIKAGMSINTEIITDMKENVLVVPNSSVKSQNNSKYVEMFDAPLNPSTDGLIGSISKIAPRKILIEAGISNDSMTEIISGVQEGDKIVSRTILPNTKSAATTAPSIFGSSGGATRTGGVR